MPRNRNGYRARAKRAFKPKPGVTRAMVEGVQTSATVAEAAAFGNVSGVAAALVKGAVKANNTARKGG